MCSPFMIVDENFLSYVFACFFVMSAWKYEFAAPVGMRLDVIKGIEQHVLRNRPSVLPDIKMSTSR